MSNKRRSMIRIASILFNIPALTAPAIAADCRVGSHCMIGEDVRLSPEYCKSAFTPVDDAEGTCVATEAFEVYVTGASRGAISFIDDGGFIGTAFAEKLSPAAPAKPVVAASCTRCTVGSFTLAFREVSAAVAFREFWRDEKRPKTASYFSLEGRAIPLNRGDKVELGSPSGSSLGGLPRAVTGGLSIARLDDAALKMLAATTGKPVKVMYVVSEGFR